MLMTKIPINKLIYFFSVFWSFFLFSISVLAPILINQSPQISSNIYHFCSYFCHQIPERSLYLMGNKVAINIRCFSMFSSYFIWGVIGYRYPGKTNIRFIAISWLLITPLCLDLILDIFNFSESDNTRRFFTGFLAGIGSASLMYRTLVYVKENGDISV